VSREVVSGEKSSTVTPPSLAVAAKAI